MTKIEAIQAMKEGKKVTHTYFADDEWMTSDKLGVTYFFEDGVYCHAGEFWSYRESEGWNDGYELFNVNEPIEIIKAKNEPYILTNPYIPAGPFLFTGEKPKPTCERHHEYVESRTREGNIIHSTWECRFCGKKL